MNNDDLGLDPFGHPDDLSQDRVVWDESSSYSEPDTYKKERRLYRQLIAIYQSIKEHPEGMIANEIVKQANEILTELGSGNYDYTSHIYPTNRLLPNQMYFTSQLKTKVLSALEAIAEDYNFEEPSSILGKYMQSNSIIQKINNSSSSNSSAHQSQNQEQSVNITIEQVEELIEHSLSPEQLEEIKPELKNYKSNPKKWAFVQKMILKLLTFGITAAPIIQKMMDYFLVQTP